MKVCARLASLPPLAVPPLSCNWTVTVAEPLALPAAVKVNVPFAAMAGCAENNGWLLLLTIKSRSCADSFAVPALIAVAHVPTVCGPESSETV